MALSDLQVEASKYGKTSLLAPTYTRIESRGRVVEVAVIDGFQNTPASRYHEGIDVAVMRYHSEALKIPEGVYKLRVKAAHVLGLLARSSH